MDVPQGTSPTPTQSIQTLAMAKDALDMQLLPDLEDGVRRCTEQFDHLMGSLSRCDCGGEGGLFATVGSPLMFGWLVGWLECSSLNATTQISLK